MYQAFNIIAALIAALGLGGMWWYHNLSEDERRRVDELTIDLAWEVYQKVVDELTKRELEHVLNIARRRLGH